MGANHIAKHVLCPFYKKEDLTKIYCEGTDDTNTIQLAFITKEKRRDYEIRVCCKNFEDCLIASMLYEKY